MFQPIEGKTLSVILSMAVSGVTYPRFVVWVLQYLHVILLIGASGVLYAAQRLAIFALARPDGSDPGRRALAQWFPIAAVAITAIVWNANDPQLQKHLASIAMAIVFGTSLACLSLVLGMATFLTPLRSLPPSRRLWPFVFPAALIALMAGFSAHLTLWHGLMLLALGGAILLVWLNSPESLDGASANHLNPGPAAAVMVGVAVICALGALMGVKGILISSVESSHGSRMLSPGMLAATILSPLLVLPTLGTASAVAQRGYPGRALTALVGTVLLNLCALLPILVFLWYLKTGHWSFAGFKEILTPFESAHGLPYDMSIWRIETVILVMLGFALVPVSMGRWAVGQLESVLLVVAYAAYILVQVVFGLQLI